MAIISKETKNPVVPFSARPRLSPESLLGSWNVFQMIAMVVYPEPSSSNTTYPTPSSSLSGSMADTEEENKDKQPSLVYSCRECVRKRKPQSFADDGKEVEYANDILWLPGGVSSHLQPTSLGGVVLAVGWLGSDGSRLSMEREYDENGCLAEVRCNSEVRGGWVGGRM
ncbi:hypothetical protein CBR_g48168 [Chara braunii]|uniref:Biogenesis factor required for ATP synthase 1-like C-terminal domain-containing protein n=1 Tax=Chara braunii TaxID=69332 RepID=A0A388M233_CHABU|nr:hypothetical protein CBR_g48168 [Chara braunii]|eukprot:GBG88637.1 hypothetical protein CBR_g48168 [Chara braunii]